MLKAKRFPAGDGQGSGIKVRHGTQIVPVARHLNCFRFCKVALSSDILICFLGHIFDSKPQDHRVFRPPSFEEDPLEVDQAKSSAQSTTSSPLTAQNETCVVCS